MAKLIVEAAYDIQYLTEEKDGVKNLYIEGIYMQANTKNKNGRIYPGQIMENEVNRYVKEKVATGRAYGELDHPDEPSVKLERVSHRIVSLKMEGNDVIGKAIVSNEGRGKIVRGLIEMGSNLGVSSRGLGSLKPINGIMEVQSDFKICAAADIVSDPSAPNAFVQGIMENVDWIFENGNWKAVEAAERIQAQVKKMSSRELEEAKFRLFKNYLNLLNN
jgi:hypothetical protein